MGLEVRRKVVRPVYETFQPDVDRLHAKLKKGDSLKLQFGCGPRIFRNWVNIDIAYEPYDYYLQFFGDTYPKEIRGTREDLYVINFLKTGIPLPDNSVDIVFHEDFFEHLHQKEQMLFLAETLRVLKPGGVHRINTPNLAASMRDYSDFTKGMKGVFVGEWDNWDHYNVIDDAILEDMSKIVGYSRFVSNHKNGSIVANQLPPEYRPNPNDRAAPDSNVFADLIK